VERLIQAVLVVLVEAEVLAEPLEQVLEAEEELLAVGVLLHQQVQLPRYLPRSHHLARVNHSSRHAALVYPANSHSDGT